MDREELEQVWLTLTRETMPSLAAERRWPVRFDHCFQRILLDNACGQVWYDAITGRPAYKHADASLLEGAVLLGEQVVAGEADLASLNQQSLRFRGRA
ncbi:MAG: GCN5-related N-acetyltransferase [Parvularculaceae bacterium]|nr:GCN5-related N-acetyltransferase [Parvularculaceae bacterium]